MMVLILTFILHGSFTHAASAEFSSAAKTWSAFKDCGKVKGEAAIDKCLDATLMPGMDGLARQKMTEYILMGFKFSDLHVCDERDTVLPVKTKETPIHYCLSVLGHRSRTQGYATFEKHQDNLRLTSVRYDF